MFVKITDARFGGIKMVQTADDTGLVEGGSFRLVSMALTFCDAHLHQENGVHCVTGHTGDGQRKTTARLTEVIAL